ncbi:hypothetical protein L0U85_17210 [Glycomyces sp. L485]|uniref:hypothetical protein n=1 Tax=Glycomyces sp. L485 TaxID=2909235 RepID=UPI001F4BB9E0|nr:hypothetical protein [Glycomyces sp. L485]MCH7232578.1 hypothetical protein [Glycomyces sp. L485]
MAYPPQPPGPSRPGGADPLIEWGVKPHPGRPQKVNWLTQVLWAYMAIAVLMLLFSIIAVATAPLWMATGFIVTSGIVGLIFHALSIVLVWFIVKERLGVFGAQEPRTALYIGLGVLGFFSLFGFFGGWGLGWYAAFGALLGLAKLGAVGAAFFLVFQPEVAQWLRSKPGNLPRQQPPQQPMPPGQPPQGHPQQGYPQQPPSP